MLRALPPGHAAHDQVRAALGAPGRPLGLDDQNPDRALLSMAESMVHERELAWDVTYELEHHPAAGRHGERLHAANWRPGWRAKIDGVELLADNVEMGWMCRPAVHHPETHAIANLHVDWIADVLTGTPVEHDVVGHRRQHLVVVERAHPIRRLGEIELALHEHELFRRREWFAWRDDYRA